MYYKAKPYQGEAIKYLLARRNAALFLGCSLGKTSVTGSVLHCLKLKNDPDVQKGNVLIIAPALAAEETWPAEFHKWDHLQKYTMLPITGTIKQRVKKLGTRKDFDFLTISAGNISWLVDYYGSKWPFTCVVIDELSMFKSSDSKRVKSLIKIRKYVKRTIGLTGTPMPNGHEDLWAEFRLVDDGERLHRTFKEFKYEFMEPFDTIKVGSPGHQRVVDLWRVTRKGAEEIINRITPITLSMRTIDKLQMPKLIISDHTCTLTPKLKEFQRTFIRDKLALCKDDADGNKVIQPYTLAELEQIMDEDRLGDVITVKSAGVLQFKLQQWANGAVYSDDGSTVYCHDVKAQMLENILTRLGGERALIAYWFKSDREQIKALFDKLKIPCHEILTPKDIQNWNAGLYPVCLVHPARCGRALNLQDGGHHLIWYSLCWSLELYEQLCYRLYRQGQAGDTVVIHRIIVKDTVDEQIRDVLNTRDLEQQELFHKTGDLTPVQVQNIVQHFVEEIMIKDRSAA